MALLDDVGLDAMVAGDDHVNEVIREGRQMQAWLIGVDDFDDIDDFDGMTFSAIGTDGWGDGTLPENQAAYLVAIGDFLRVNGEGIYETRPWKTFGEGPLKIKDGRQGENRNDFSQQDIRFTTKDGVLYAYVLARPTEDIVIKTLASLGTGISVSAWLWIIGVDYAVDNRLSEERILPLAQDLGIAVLVYLPFGRSRLWTRTKDQTVPEWAADFGADSWGKFFLALLGLYDYRGLNPVPPELWLLPDAPIAHS